MYHFDPIGHWNLLKYWEVWSFTKVDTASWKLRHKVVVQSFKIFCCLFDAGDGMAETISVLLVDPRVTKASKVWERGTYILPHVDCFISHDVNDDNNNNQWRRRWTHQNERFFLASAKLVRAETTYQITYLYLHVNTYLYTHPYLDIHSYLRTYPCLRTHP